MQMGEEATSSVQARTRKGKSSVVNAPMTAEEYRLNKALLREIKKKKKERMMSEGSEAL